MKFPLSPPTRVLPGSYQGPTTYQDVSSAPVISIDKEPLARSIDRPIAHGCEGLRDPCFCFRDAVLALIQSFEGGGKW